MAKEHSKGDARPLPLPSGSSAPLPQGVEYIPHPYCDEYKGTAQALIAASLLTADQLPGRPGNGASQTTFYKGERVRRGASNPTRDEHHVRVRKEARGLISVLRGLSDEERSLRKSEHDKPCEAERQEETRSQAEKERRHYADPESLRRLAAGYLRILVQVIEVHVEGAPESARRSNPFADYTGKLDYAGRFSAAGIAEVRDALTEIREWIQQAEISVPDGLAQKVQLARADSGFQAFMQAQCLTPTETRGEK